MIVAGEDDAAYDAFAQSGEVEVGDSNKAPGDTEKKEVKTPAVAEQGADGEGENAGENGGNVDDEGGDGEGEEGQQNEGYMKRLKRERAEARREARETKIRLETLETAMRAGGVKIPENAGGQADPAGGKSAAAEPSPDPLDQTKYPLGHLDPAYMEDKLSWLAEDRAARQAQAALSRQQEETQRSQQETTQRAIMAQVDDLASRGSEIYDDYQEKVVDAGLKGEWPLSQTTFEAAHEAEHGERILYALANDKAEAKRVSELPMLKQLRYVEEKNAEIAKNVTPRRKPGATPPPSREPRGANSTTKINPATDDLAQFEKAWEADAKGK